MEELYEQWVNDFYDKYAKHDYLQDEDFKSIAIGFFIAKGQDPQSAIKIYYNYCVKKGKF